MPLDSRVFSCLNILVPVNKKSKSLGPPPKLTARDVVTTRGKKKASKGRMGSQDVPDSVAKRLRGKKRFATIPEGSLRDSQAKRFLKLFRSLKLLKPLILIPPWNQLWRNIQT